MLENSYLAMTRSLERVDFEREKVRFLLEKTERTDVRDHEDELLSEVEVRALKAWEKREEKLLTTVSRLDDLVLIIRDFLSAKTTVDM